MLTQSTPLTYCTAHILRRVHSNIKYSELYYKQAELTSPLQLHKPRQQCHHDHIILPSCPISTIRAPPTPHDDLLLATNPPLNKLHHPLRWRHHQQRHLNALRTTHPRPRQNNARPAGMPPQLRRPRTRRRDTNEPTFTHAHGLGCRTIWRSGADR